MKALENTSFSLLALSSTFSPSSVLPITFKFILLSFITFETIAPIAKLAESEVPVDKASIFVLSLAFIETSPFVVDSIISICEFPVTFNSL